MEYTAAIIISDLFWSFVFIKLGIFLIKKPKKSSERVNKFLSNYPLVRYYPKKLRTTGVLDMVFSGWFFVLIGLVAMIHSVFVIVKYLKENAF